jgi:hypothetical protein
MFNAYSSAGTLEVTDQHAGGVCVVIFCCFFHQRACVPFHIGGASNPTPMFSTQTTETLTLKIERGREAGQWCALITILAWRAAVFRRTFVCGTLC